MCISPNRPSDKIVMYEILRATRAAVLMSRRTRSCLSQLCYDERLRRVVTGSPPPGFIVVTGEPGRENPLLKRLLGNFVGTSNTAFWIFDPISLLTRFSVSRCDLDCHRFQHRMTGMIVIVDYLKRTAQETSTLSLLLRDEAQHSA